MSKYNWEEIKIEYIESEEVSVLWFFKKKFWLKQLTWAMNKNTKGWAEDKLRIKQEALKIAEKNVTKKLGKIYTPSQEELSQWYEAVMGIFRAKAISNYQKIKKLPDWTIIIPPDVTNADNKILWEIFKTERGEPTRIIDREDYVPPDDDNDDEDIVFYLPNNGRDSLPVWQEK